LSRKPFPVTLSLSPSATFSSFDSPISKFLNLSCRTVISVPSSFFNFKFPDSGYTFSSFSVSPAAKPSCLYSFRTLISFPSHSVCRISRFFVSESVLSLSGTKVFSVYCGLSACPVCFLASFVTSAIVACVGAITNAFLNPPSAMICLTASTSGFLASLTSPALSKISSAFLASSKDVCAATLTGSVAFRCRIIFVSLAVEMPFSSSNSAPDPAKTA